MENFAGEKTVCVNVYINEYSTILKTKDRLYFFYMLAKTAVTIAYFSW